MYQIAPISDQFLADIKQKINMKTKPLGALGQLETLAIQLGQIYSTTDARSLDKLEITNPTLIVFAGDHGIAAHGVSIAPSEVTQQMVMNFASGGAAINVFTRQLGWSLDVVDAGILQAVPMELGIFERRLGNGTDPIHLTSAMSKKQVLAGFDYAKELVTQRVNGGCNLIAFGEMGIGNTSSASAIMAVVLEQAAIDTVGRGTGIDDAVLETKVRLVQQAIDRFDNVQATTPRDQTDLAISLLAELGGFEIVQICGAMLAAAELKIPIVVDGFICTAAAMVAKLINTNVSDYFIFAHTSGEQGHQKMLSWFDAKPLLDLGLRLGEGTGAALSLPLIEAACAFYNDMASFDDAQVENVVEAQ